MKGIVYRKYGSPDNLHLEEIIKPVPMNNEVLLKIKAASVNAYDWRHIRADPFLIRLMGAGLFKPKHPILGADMAGIVEAAGTQSRFKPGDAVFGEGGYGGFAEYASVNENRFVLKPDNISFEEAAAAPMAALTSLQGLRDNGNIQPGQKVLINGASGGVGTFAVQIAKSFGAEVTGVCSTSKMDLVHSIGADHVIDYTKTEIINSNEKYDLILDIAAHNQFKKIKRILNKDGKYVIAGGDLSHIFGFMLLSKTGVRNISVMVAKIIQNDLMYIKGLLETGRIKSVIDKCFPLHETPEAIRYLEEGKARGKIIITIG